MVCAAKLTKRHLNDGCMSWWSCTGFCRQPSSPNLREYSVVASQVRFCWYSEWKGRTGTGTARFPVFPFPLWIKQSDPHPRDPIPEHSRGAQIFSDFPIRTLCICGYWLNGGNHFNLILRRVSRWCICLLSGTLYFYTFPDLMSHIDCLVCIGIPSNESAFNTQRLKCLHPLG